MARWVGGIVLGGRLWVMWTLFWRGAAWPVVALGAAFPVTILTAVRIGLLRREFPISAWTRVDLWATFARAFPGSPWTGRQPSPSSVPWRLRRGSCSSGEMRTR